MRASDWVWNEAASQLNHEARIRGIRSDWRKIQGGAQYAATGMTVPGLREFVGEVSGKQFQRNDWCVGATAINGRDFEIGAAQALGMYVGIRIHTGGSTPNQIAHDMIYRNAFENLNAIDSDLIWNRRQSGGFWSIYADVPTSSRGQVYSAEEYIEIIVDLALEGWLAVQGLW